MDIRAWAMTAVAEMTEEEVNRVLTEGADWYSDDLGRNAPPTMGRDDVQRLVEEIERLCRERVALEEIEEEEQE